jgi:hypothetical protein
VLVPLEASLSAALAPRAIFELAREATIEAVALHVYEEDSLPAFTDQPQHEQLAWAQEFLARYCPTGLGSVRLETRVGCTDELVPLVADECGCDLVALGWSQELAPGRAPSFAGRWNVRACRCCLCRSGFECISKRPRVPLPSSGADVPPEQHAWRGRS